MRQLRPPTTFETVQVVGNFGGKRQHLLVPADRKGEWLVVPPTFKVLIDDETTPYKLEMKCAVNTKNNVVEIVSFKATKRHVQIQDNGLKSISLAAIRAEAIRRIGLLMIKGEDGQFHSNLLEPKKDVSQYVIHRAVDRRKQNTRDLNEAKQIANFARALIEKGVKDWRQQTEKEFCISKAGYYRYAKQAKFKAKEQIRKAKKK